MVKVSREQSERLRRRVLDATVAELAASGPASLAVTAVADRAGVATSAVSHRFPTKERLIGAAVRERLEPLVGPGCDEVSAWLWGPPGPVPTRRRSATDHEARDAWNQVLVAAAFPSGPRADALALLERRLEHGLALRGTAPAGTVRSGPEPTAQALLPVAVDVGTWLLTRGLGRPPRPEPGTMATVRAAVRIEPVPGVATPPAPSRSLIGAPPARHGHDPLGQDLLDATTATIEIGGFTATTVERIARRAGSSTGAVYNRFTGKGGLLAEALRSTGANGADDGCAALLVESLRLAPADPEVAAAVTTTVGYTLTVEAHAVAAARRDGAAPTSMGPRVAARLRVAFSCGHWVLGRVLDAPVDAWRADAAELVAGLTATPVRRPGHGDGTVSEAR